MTLYDQYIDDVQSGRVNVCELVKLAINRHLSDIDKSKHNDFPYHFDRVRADHAIKTFQGFRHTQDVYQGKPFNLQPWQAFIEASKWGWRSKDTQALRFFTSYVEVPRKNGKTELIGGEMVYAFEFEGVRGAEVYSAATYREQAEKAYKAAFIMIGYIMKESPYYRKVLNYRYPQISNTLDYSVMRPLSRDREGSLDGFNTSFAAIDELHAHKSRATLDVIESSTGSRASSHISQITTAGFNKDWPCYQIRSTGIDVLKGIKEDDNKFVMIWTIDEGDDWNDENVWIKANPNYNVSILPSKLRAAHTKAANEGGIAEIEFRTKRLNEWCDTAATWIKDDIVIACGADYTIEDFRGRECFIGLDLATLYDINSMCLFFPSRNGKEPHRTLSFHFIGEDSLKERVHRDHVDYYKWQQQGFIYGTPGNSTDYSFVKQKILSLATNGIRVIEIAYDRWNAYEIIHQLQDQGLTCCGFGQGFASMSTPTKALSKLYNNVNAPDRMTIQHNRDPVLRWAFSNVNMKIDEAGNYKVDKGKSSEKVDPVVAQIMAFGQYMDHQLRNQQKIVGLEVF